MTDPSSSFLPSFTPLEPPRYEEIRVTFPADRARQLTALETFLASEPSSRLPGGEARARLAREGVHHLRRAEVWAECSGAWDLADSSAVSYDEYLDRGVCDDRHAEQRERIRRDVPAVFPNHPRFVRAAADARRRDAEAEAGDAASSGYSARSDGTCAAMSVSNASSVSNARPRAEYCLLDALERVLVATCARAPQGYVASLCAVAATLLLVTEDEEGSFWILQTFRERLAPWLFTRSQVALVAETRAFDVAVERDFPALGAKLRAAGVSRPSLLVAGWFTRLGVGVLPGEASLRLWDALVLEGGDVLTQAALAFVRLHGDALVSVPESDGAALLDAAEELAAAQFAFGPLVSHAVDACEAARENAAWLRCRADRRAETARNAAAVGSLRELIHAFRNADANVDAPGGDGDFFGGEGERGEGERASASASPSEGGVPTSSPSVTRRAFREMVRDAFSFSGEEVHSEAAVAALRAFDVAAKTKANASERPRRRTRGGRRGSREEALATSTSNAEEDETRVSFSEWSSACDSLDAATASRVALASLRGDSPEARVRDLLEGDERRAATPLRASDDSDEWAPSPARLATAVRAARAAIFGEDPERSGAAAAEAALESAMLFGRGGERWLESVRLDPRGAFVLAAASAAAYAAGSDALPLPGEEAPARRRTSRGSPRANRVAFEVSVAGSRDVAPSMGGLFFSWPPRAPHASYQLLVQTPGAAAPRRVEKRFNDFRRLHLDAEAEGVTRVAGSALALPDLGSLAFAQSTDPSVKAAREVGLQRYLDVLAASGSPEANRVLRAFLGVRGEEEAFDAFGGGKGAFGGGKKRAKSVRGALASCGAAMGCAPEQSLEERWEVRC